MSDPLLLAVEDDPAALADVERELRERYGSSYRVVCTRSPEEALATLERAAGDGDEAALVLASQWLEGTTGSALLERVRQLHPHAKRALLVPWRASADQPTSQAILDSMALGRIDYYVLLPATSPDELFHHAISTFLLEWTKAVRIAPHTVHIVGEAWAGRAYELRETFQRCAVPHAFCLADTDEGRELLERAGPEARKLPLVLLPDGRVLSDPDNRELAEAAGAVVDLERDDYDLVIVGAGPAGLSAAVYGASEGLRTLVVDEGGIGGQATSSSLIRNYLGFPRGISGGTLAAEAYEQAWVFGSGFLFMHRATSIERAGDRLVVTVEDGRHVTGRALLLATGAAYRRLGVPALEELNGAGVFYGGPTAEGHAMAGREAYVVGGANSAGQAALHLARFARQVTLVVRADSVGAGMSHYLVREVEATPNIRVRTGAEVVGGGGDGRLEHLVLRDGSGEETTDADGLFVLIGARPHTGWLPDEIARDEHGFVLTGDDLPGGSGWALERRPLTLETTMPGVFAAGDVRHGSVKRVASAVGEGSIAIQSVHALFASDRKATAGVI
ncbi:MAG: FAD-dependent oxidoreductase [Actinomycetota bacterium]|nr:FAD-dependent oxidoreductase [Actinomycetota bacterium]